MGFSVFCSLGKETRPCFRVHFSDGLAFVCKAHTIESGEKSYLVDWGLPGANEPLKNVLERESKRGGLRIHTFLYPTSTVRDRGCSRK